MTTGAPVDLAMTADDAMRRAGLKVTASRRAVYEALRDRSHASADDVYRRVIVAVPATSLQSVYNALGDFVEAGLARRIEPAGRPGLFELRVDDNHHHLVCTTCGDVEDVDCAEGDAPCLHPRELHGFEVRTAEITFWGLCAACAKAATTTS